jgi:hypothetical protein
MQLEDLDELVDILDEITAESEEDTSYFNEDAVIELTDELLHVMELYIQDNAKGIAEPDFEETFFESVKELMVDQFKVDPFFTEEAEDEFDNILNCAMEQFFETFMPRRSHSNSKIIRQLTPNMVQELEKQLKYLEEKPQPEQRSKEWYEFRQNLITASNAYKAFESETVKNQLIYEKCNIKDGDKVEPEMEVDAGEDETNVKVINIATATINRPVNINTSLHHGQKYENVSVMLYEDEFDTIIQDFGCIQHDKYSFLGASPDGINVNKKSPRYGRMLEIKNIVNREIDGIPKKEYWVQMQMQMETCKLPECDFLETKFVEYEFYEQFKEDGTFLLSNNDEKKGIIMYFNDKEGNPKYVYKPIKMNEDEFTSWETNMLDLMQSPEYGYMWIKNCYWRVETFSCVLVERNQFWFENNVQDLINLWKTVEKERVTGFQHRAPSRKSSSKKLQGDLTPGAGSGCLLNFNKLTGKVNLNVVQKLDASA